MQDRLLPLVQLRPTDLIALAPNHFILESACSVLLSHERTDVDQRQRYARAQAYSDAVWNRRLKEYVPSLNRRAKWSTQSDKELRTGDLAWIVEPTSTRAHYLLSRVDKLNFRCDAVARSEDEKWIPRTFNCKTHPGSSSL